MDHPLYKVPLLRSTRVWRWRLAIWTQPPTECWHAKVWPKALRRVQGWNGGEALGLGVLAYLVTDTRYVTHTHLLGGRVDLICLVHVSGKKILRYYVYFWMIFSHLHGTWAWHPLFLSLQSKSWDRQCCVTIIYPRSLSRNWSIFCCFMVDVHKLSFLQVVSRFMFVGSGGSTSFIVHYL